MEEQVTSGVENAPAAAEQNESTESEFDLEKLLFGEADEPGEDVQDAADPVDEPEQGKSVEPEGDLPEDASKAFAKKWAAEKEKLEESIRTKVLSEIEERTRTTPTEQNQGAGEFKELTAEQLEKLAEEFEVSPKVANILYQQQQMINRQLEDSKRRTQLDRERTEYGDSRKHVDQLRSTNPSLPEWDDDRLRHFRNEHYRHYGTTLPWNAAYQMMVANAVVSGDLTRQAQQDVINKIQKRENDSVTIKAPSTNKKTISDLSPDEFTKLKEEVKLGKYTKS